MLASSSCHDAISTPAGRVTRDNPNASRAPALSTHSTSDCVKIHADWFSSTGKPGTMATRLSPQRNEKIHCARLVPRAALDHVHADARAGVVVVAGIARLPPQVEPRFGMLVTPQQHGLTGAGAVETAGLDQFRRPPGPFRALVRRQRPVAGRDRPQARGVERRSLAEVVGLLAQTLVLKRMGWRSIGDRQRLQIKGVVHDNLTAILERSTP